MVQYANQSIDSKCPVCQSTDIHNLYSVSAEKSAQHFVSKESDRERNEYLVSHIKKLWNQDVCNVNQCKSCSFCFADPYISGDYDFYRIAHPRHGYPKWKWENQITLDLIANESKQKDTATTRLLEIGAGNGAFVKRVSDIIPAKNITCTEYSEYAIKSIRSLGIECYSQDVIEFGDEYNNQFDYVCLFQVLEHLDGLDSLFDKIDKITRDDAKIFIAVPNEKFIEFIETHNALLDMPPNHIGRWNASAFNVIANKYGWRVIKHQYEPGNTPFVMAHRFCVYRFLNEAQRSGTFANRVASIKNRYIRYGLLQLISVLYGVTSIKGLIRSMSKDIGMAQWVCIGRNK